MDWVMGKRQLFGKIASLKRGELMQRIAHENPVQSDGKTPQRKDALAKKEHQNNFWRDMSVRRANNEKGQGFLKNFLFKKPGDE